VTDLERFFRRLVASLADSDPALLHRPLPLADIQQSILPYRSNRRALGIDSSEDYEMVLLRLVAGEGGLVRTEPETARARFAEEVHGPNPDLSVLHRFEDVVITLRSEPLARALGPGPQADLSYAPPDLPPSGLDLPELDPVDETDEFADVNPETVPVADPHCLYCGGRLLIDRPARFCPHCGQPQSPPTCPQCRNEVEPGWRHCVSCGASLRHR
jgi:hypothetical protein